MNAQAETTTRPRVKRGTVPDVAFPSDNEFGIPTLLTELQGTADDEPFIRWGSVARWTVNRGAWHFYTDDYRFSGLWANPQQVVNSQCTATVEANYSTSGTMPRAAVLYDLYRKRWLARFWQSRGVRIFVDLNIHPAHREAALLGVPRGWTAYATRSHRGFPPETLEREHAAAVAHAGTDRITFRVFGGGPVVRDLCAARGWLWTMEDADLKGKKGRFTTDGKERRQRPSETAPRQDSEPRMGGHDEPRPPGTLRQGQPGPGEDVGQEVLG